MGSFDEARPASSCPYYQKHDAHHVLKDMVWGSARALDLKNFQFLTALKNKMFLTCSRIHALKGVVCQNPRHQEGVCGAWKTRGFSDEQLLSQGRLGPCTHTETYLVCSTHNAIRKMNETDEWCQDRLLKIRLSSLAEQSSY